MENAAWGVLGFITALTAVLVVQLLGKVNAIQRQVLLLLKQQGIDPTKPPEISDHVKELARDPSRKIEAIKQLREETGMGLAEAKNVVERLAREAGA